ncbi:hypothetical protein [Nonomuraea sp. B5E05]|uniref:hypothetical protein n=1 Tax=Nonomuraea sp. B5E05 TaxID=3153569 RepID=UPI00326080A6
MATVTPNLAGCTGLGATTQLGPLTHCGDAVLAALPEGSCDEAVPNAMTDAATSTMASVLRRDRAAVRVPCPAVPVSGVTGKADEGAISAADGGPSWSGAGTSSPTAHTLASSRSSASVAPHARAIRVTTPASGGLAFPVQ